MKIDEAIEVIKGTQPFTFGRGKFADAVETLVDFAEWYKEQDLISREDAIGEIEYECHCYQSEILHRLTITDVIEQIPKAEPPKE